MLQFSTPWLLWGAAAAALPVLIHLFGKRKTREVAFSSLRFLQAMQKEHIRTLHLKQLIILILRTLFILLLVLAFAGPRYAPSSARSMANESAVIILDNSVSSSAEIDGKPLLEVLASMAGSLVSGSGRYQTVIWTSLMHPETRILTAESAIPEDFLTTISPGEGHSDLRSFFRDLRNWLGQHGYGRVDVYLLTDGQRAQYIHDNQPDPEAWDGSRWVVVTPEQTLHQAGIQSVDFSTDMLQPGTSVPLQVHVTRSDTLEPATTAIQVRQDGKKIGQTLVSWDRRLDASETFEVPVRNPGFFQLEVSLGHDAYAADNQWYLNGHVPEGMDVLLVSDSPDDRYFLETALRSITGAQQTTTFQSVSSAAFLEHLTSSVDLVILSDVMLPAPARRALLQRVATGTGLMIFPGNNLRGHPGFTYGENLPVLSGYTRLEEGAFQPVQSIDWTHPVLRNLSNQKSAAIQLPQVYRFFTLASRNARPIIQMGNGDPLLLESRYQQGRVWTWAAAPELQWMDLPRRGLFLPLLMRSLYYLSGTQNRYQNLVTAGETITFGVADAAVGDQVTLITPAGKSVLLPVLRGTVTYEKTTQAGQYSLYNGEQKIALFSTNIPSAERDMARMSAQDWQVFFGPGFEGVFHPEAGNTVRVNAGLAYGRPLWQWFFALALLCIAVEMVLIRTDSQTQEEDADLYE